MQGALWEGVLPGVLRSLYVGRRTGVLSFTRENERCGVRFRLGNILSADTTVRENRLGETLVRQGRLTPVDLKRAMGFALRDGKRLGAALMDLGLLDPPGLEEAVTIQAHQVLKHVFSWSDGSYEFFEEAPDRALDGDVTLRLSTGELILQAARSVRDPDVVRYNLGDIDRILSLSADPLLRYQRISLSPVDGYVLSRVDGTLSAREVMQITPLPPEDVQRSLFGLLSTGVLEYLPGPSKAKPPVQAPPPQVEARVPPQGQSVGEPQLDEPAVQEPAVQEPAEEGPAVAEAWGTTLPPSEELAPTLVWPALSDFGALPQAAPSEQLPATQVWPTLDELLATAGMAAPSDSAPTQRLAPVDTRRLEVLEAHDGLALRTHFQVLGVRRDATEAQVREAYFRMAKRFHPDVHHDAALSDLRDKLEEIFTRLGEAYEVLCSPRIRASYERELARREGAQAGATVSADQAQETEAAAAAIERGSESLAQERYWEAIRLFESAIPRAEGALKQQARILLARAYAKNPGWVKQGEELLLWVLREEANNLDALLQLGRIYKGLGLRSRALSTLRRVLELAPANEEARHLIADLGP
jgi:tetratricopeptide (TPR) repeat protein